MLDTSYLQYPFALVENLNDFYMTSDKLPEVIKVHGILDATRILYKLPPRRIKLYVAEGARIYKIEMYTPQGTSKIPIGWFIYLPTEKRIDLYDGMTPNVPAIQWKNKKPVWMSCSLIYQYAQIEKLFQGIILSS